MKRRALATALAALCYGAGAAAQDATPRTPWGHPDLQGTWTNATLTPLQRPVELGDKEFYTPEELEAFAAQRRAATNADRPLSAGEVGSYNDVFFERGSGGVKTGRTSLVVPFRNRSEVTGGEESISLATVPLRDGNLLYVLLVSPREEAGAYNAPFRRALESLRLGQQW